MMLWKCCTQYASKFGKLSSDHRTGKGQFSFQSQRKVEPKNVQITTTALISHSSKVMLKFCQARLQQHVNHELPMFKLVLEKAEEQEIKLPTSVGLSRKQGSSRKTSTSALTTPKPLLCGSQQTVENSERDGNTTLPDLPLEKPVCRSGSNS